MRFIDQAPGTKIEMDDLLALIGARVVVTVRTPPNNPHKHENHIAGTVQTVSQTSHDSASTSASEGAIHFVGGTWARWTRHDIVTVITGV